MSTTSYKIKCVELTKTKQTWLITHINEYARIYNEASKYIPSLPYDKYLSSTNPSELYTKWIKGSDGSQLLQSSILSGLQIFNALKDACSNYKTRKALKQKDTSISFIKKPNIIKFENSEYEIRKTNERRYIIQVNGKNGIRIPLITNDPIKESIRKVKGTEWGVIEHLNLGIQMQSAKKERNKELARKKKEYQSTKREKGIKAGLGVITYNLRDNTISIPYTVQTPRFQKKDTRNTFIGIDRGYRNSIVLSAIFVDPIKLNGIKEYQEMFDEPIISQQLFRSLKGLNAQIVGTKIIKSSFINDKKRRIKKINEKRQKKRKDVGNRYKNISETVSHQISAEAIKFISQFRNPVVFFEDLNIERKKRRHKYGKRNSKSTRRMLSKWDYGSIRRKIEHKLESYGIWTMGINPMYTSQYCSHCGVMGVRDGIGFKCNQCGLGVSSNLTDTIGQYNADINASINIALKGLFALYGQKVRVVTDLNEQPDEIILKPIPTVMMSNEGIKIRKSETVTVCQSQDETVETNVSRSILCGSVQSTVKSHRAGSASENGFSSYYKQINNLSGRTELSEKTDNKGMV